MGLPIQTFLTVRLRVSLFKNLIKSTYQECITFYVNNMLKIVPFSLCISKFKMVLKHQFEGYNLESFHWGTPGPRSFWGIIHTRYPPDSLAGHFAGGPFAHLALGPQQV